MSDLLMLDAIATNPENRVDRPSGILYAALSVVNLVVVTFLGHLDVPDRSRGTHWALFPPPALVE
jgi:hypothetical protein